MSAIALVATTAMIVFWAPSYVATRRARTRLRPPPPGHEPSRITPWRWTAERLAATAAAAAGCVAGLASIVGPVALVLGAVAIPTVPVAVRRRRRAEQRRLRQTQLPSALDRLATALRGGSSVPTALIEAGSGLPPPIGPELAALGREADAGRAVADVLDGWSARNDDAGTRLAATALALANAIGGAPGHAVDGVAATLRERVDLADERRALASQARLSALVLAVAPVGFAVLLAAGNGRASDFLLRSPAGWVCLSAGLALDGIGAWWMARLTRGTEP
jgi:tight adherence protein B